MKKNTVENMSDREYMAYALNVVRYMYASSGLTRFLCSTRDIIMGGVLKLPRMSAEQMKNSAGKILNMYEKDVILKGRKVVDISKSAQTREEIAALVGTYVSIELLPYSLNVKMMLNENYDAIIKGNRSSITKLRMDGSRQLNTEIRNQLEGYWNEASSIGLYTSNFSTILAIGTDTDGSGIKGGSMVKIIASINNEIIIDNLGKYVSPQIIKAMTSGLI